MPSATTTRATRAAPSGRRCTPRRYLEGRVSCENRMLSAGLLIAGKYRVIKKLGEGAMGSVWLAKNEITDREFAIKVLLPQAAGAPTALARFLREARVCGA